MASLWRIKEAAASIEAGDVIACPAEAVWGLSCDPWNLSAVAFLCEMKQRELSKGVIVASGDAAHFGPLLDALDDDERRCVLSSWPGPVTWLVPNRGYFPSWVTGESNEVAIRVTSAPALSILSRIGRSSGQPVPTGRARSRRSTSFRCGDTSARRLRWCPVTWIWPVNHPR